MSSDFQIRHGMIGFAVHGDGAASASGGDVDDVDVAGELGGVGDDVRQGIGRLAQQTLVESVLQLIGKEGEVIGPVDAPRAPNRIHRSNNIARAYLENQIARSVVVGALDRRDWRNCRVSMGGGLAVVR